MQHPLHTARRHHQSACFAEAEKIYRQILAGQPTQAAIWYELGITLTCAGRFDEAIDAYRRALELNPRSAEAHNNLGVALKEQGDAAAAIVAYRKAIQLRPDFASAFINLANVLKDTGQLDESIAACRRAIAIKADLPEAHNSLGVVLRQAGALDEGIAACARAIALRPTFAEARNNLGVALEDKGEFDQAAAELQQTIALKPGYAEAHYNLGNVHKARGNIAEAIASYRRAIQLNPKMITAHNNLIYALHFDPQSDAPALAAEQRRWSQAHALPLAKRIQPHRDGSDPGRRLRIGYVSPDLREHPVGRFMLPLLAKHDHSSFEIFVYAQSPAIDSLARQLRLHIDCWRTMTGFSDQAVAEMIRGDRIDILLDLTMHMAGSRLRVFASRPAPVQMTWLAYAGSTGVGTIDYRLSDPHLDPPGMDESIYAEQTIRLPETYWCYAPPVDPPPTVGPPPALKSGHIVFGCLNNFCKVSEPALSLWAAILRAMPDSQLLLHAPPGSARQRVIDHLGVIPDRIIFAGKYPTRDYLALYNQIDIALDTFPYGGGTTTCDALWMGVPVISKIGHTAVGRGGLSILSNLGLAELAVVTDAEYVNTAVALAADLSRLTSLRASLRSRMEQSPLMNAPRFARHFESVCRQMWLSCSQ